GGVTWADVVEDGLGAGPAFGAGAHGAGEAAMVGVGATPMPMEATVVMAAGGRIGGILTGTPIGPVGAGGGPCLMPMVA
ncbi:hypothetical protein, partial [Acetobacter okinawensis]|uniref:hypothetical protein n=1 Tax=Acetobacter okinawensis TaxID=1076594 RepID=UPI0039EA9D14